MAMMLFGYICTPCSSLDYIELTQEREIELIGFEKLVKGCHSKIHIHFCFLDLDKQCTNKVSADYIFHRTL
jgi:hypothetical protein